MDGVVVVAERSGALHYSRSFSPRFDRLHPRSERMNLGALLFALQSFAGDSVLDGAGGKEELPAITMFETAEERVVLARSRAKGLLIALFVHPTLHETVARSLVKRIASYYDVQDSDSRLSFALNKNSRLCIEACERAIRDEIQSRLSTYAELLRNKGYDSSGRCGFVLFYYAPYTNSSLAGATVDDTTILEEAASKESQIASPRLTSDHTASPQRMKKLYPSIRARLPSSAITSFVTKKKNAVIHFAELKSFQQLLVIPASTASVPDGDNDLRELWRHPKFGQKMLDNVLPLVETFSSVILPTRTLGTSAILQEGRWRNFAIPDLPEVCSTSKASVDLLFWKRGGSLMIQLGTLQMSNASRMKTLVADLLDALEPLARTSIRLSE